jgi:hypothetical protein
MNLPSARAAALVLLLGLVACISPAPVPQVDFSGIMRPLADCRALYAEVDARVAAAGVQHPAYHRVPGFPYLRSDRLIASYRHEVDDIDQLGAWTRRMREMDQEARDYELRNLNLPRQERADLHGRMHSCGYGLVSLELQQPEVLERLKTAVMPPEEHAGGARALGLLPLTSPLIRQGWERRAKAVSQRFDEAASTVLPPHITVWHPLRSIAAHWQPQAFDTLPEDPLGFPGLITTAWQALVEAHAPQLWLTATDRQPGHPVLQNGAWDVSAGEPVVHYQIAFTRFGDAPLVQIIYFIWSRSPQGPEMMQWRVTLDRQGEALLYDSLHPADGVPLWFPVQTLTRRTDASPAPLLIPQTQAVGGRPALQLGGARNLLLRIRDSRNTPNTYDRHGYRLAPFDLLYTLASDATESALSTNLFLPDGRLRGSDDQGIAWPWISGLPTDGAIHHFQRQAMDPIRPLHYDDARLLEHWFEPPRPAPQG